MKQVINIGGSPNDGTGDHLRDAFDKVNDNFTEIYDNSVVAETTNRTLTLTDNGAIITITSAGDTTITVPPYSSVNFPVGSIIMFIRLGTGNVTFVEGAGVNILAPDSATKLRVQYSSCGLTQISTDNWVLSGDVE